MFGVSADNTRATSIDQWGKGPEHIAGGGQVIGPLGLVELSRVPLVADWGAHIDLTKGAFSTPEEMLRHFGPIPEWLKTWVAEMSLVELTPEAAENEANLIGLGWVGALHVRSAWGAPIDLVRAVSTKNPTWDLELFFRSFDDEVTGHTCFREGQEVPSWLGLHGPLTDYIVD